MATPLVLPETIRLARASARIEHRRAKAFTRVNGMLLPDLSSYELVDPAETVFNVITTAGRDFLHTQGYDTAGGAANGFCFIGLSNDTLTETSASTVLSNEITTNGLGRAVAAFAHTAGTNTSTLTKVFTATGAEKSSLLPSK